jgi:hypothetical protein
MNFTTNPYPAVPLPEGAVHADDWSDAGKPDAFRIFTGPVWDITDGAFSVFVAGTQSHDGAVEGRFVRTIVHVEEELTPAQARAIGEALIAAADYIVEQSGTDPR